MAKSFSLLFEMELTLSPLSSSLSTKAIRDCKPRVHYANLLHSQQLGRKKVFVSSALPETAASIVLAATVVGAAATYLVRTTKASDTTGTENPVKACEDCGGSGICPVCKGEGFVLKKLSDANAERARLTASNAATRYTAGLPKKWSYCTKCSSARSCNTCGGSGQLSI